MTTPLVPPAVLADAYPLWPRQSNFTTLLENLPVQGMRIIDVGCGDGRLLRSLIEKNGAAYGIGVECSPRQLAKARALPPLPNLEIHDGVAQNLPCADASADIVIFFNSLHHIPPDAMQQSLREAARVLVPGGIVYVCEPIAYGPFFDLCRHVDDETIVRAQAQEVLSRADELGLKPLNEYLYCNYSVIATFEAFRERLVSANVDREALFAEHEPALRELFTQIGTPEPDGSGMGFDQPAIAKTFQRMV